MFPMREIAHGERVFGDPIETAGRTVIPVAAAGSLFDGRIAGAAPIGAFEITADHTRFISVWGQGALAGVLLAGVGLGLLLGRLAR